jgi:hypothetical protein
MKKRIERFLKRLKLKLYIWTTKGVGSFATQEEEISSYEKTCFLICIKTIKHKNTKFMIAPMSQKRYLENKDMDIFITINDGRIDLTNHIYHYDVKLSKRDWERITYVFDMETEKRRLKYEDIINSQIKNSLHNILERVSNLTDNTTNQGIN